MELGRRVGRRAAREFKLGGGGLRFGERVDGVDGGAGGVGVGRVGAVVGGVIAVGGGG